MEQLFKQLIEAAKKNRKGLIRLKNAAVTLQEFELASQLRELETKNFPETEEVKAAKKQAKDLNLLFRMVDLNVSEDKCWLIAETLKLYNKKKGKFDIKDAAKIRAKEVELFFTEEQCVGKLLLVT